MLEIKSVDELLSYSGGKKLEPTSPIQFTPLNVDPSLEPQFRRILFGTLIGLQVIMNGIMSKKKLFMCLF